MMPATTLEKAQVFVLLEKDLHKVLVEFRHHLDKTIDRGADPDMTTDEQGTVGTRLWNKTLPLLRDLNQAAKAFPSAAEFPTWEPTAEQLARIAKGGPAL